MAIALCQVIFQDVSLLPEDVFVNTFHFDSGPGAVTVADATDMHTALKSFYNDVHGAGVNPLAFEMSTNLQRNASQIKTFDLSTPEPRVPVLQETWTLGAGGATPNYPNEVACCLSYKNGAPFPGIPLARQRGRIFHGPLQSNVGGNSQGDMRPGPPYMIELAEAGKFLIQDVNTVWVVHSPSQVDDAAVFQDFTVTTCYVDNAFDTQRRRGRAPTSRTVLP